MDKSYDDDAIIAGIAEELRRAGIVALDNKGWLSSDETKRIPPLITVELQPIQFTLMLEADHIVAFRGHVVADKKSFDLSDPNSLDRLTRFIKSNGID